MGRPLQPDAAGRQVRGRRLGAPAARRLGLRAPRRAGRPRLGVEAGGRRARVEPLPAPPGRGRARREVLRRAPEHALRQRHHPRLREGGDSRRGAR
jgi:hypothetical protein